MKILIYYEQRGYGGVDTHLAHLINYWPDLDDTFLIVTNFDNSGLPILKKLLNNPKVCVVTLKNAFKRSKGLEYKSKKAFTFFMNNVRFIKAFKSILRKEKPSIVISNNGGYPGGMSNWIAAIIARRYTQKVFLLVHHAPVKKMKGLYSYLTSALLKLSKISRTPIITVSYASKKMLGMYTNLRNLHVIYNGLSSRGSDFDKFDYYDQFNIQEDRVLIGMIGPIDSHKGHSTILDALSCSKLLQEKAHFVIVGSGSDNFISELKIKCLSPNISNLVTFTGYLKDSSMSLVRGFDILVMPTTDFEGFGYSMAEAMLGGCPVVASKVGAIPEVITDNENGYLISPFDVKNGWVPVLEKLLNSKKTRNEIGHAGRDRILKNFSAESMSKNYCKFLKSE